MTERLRLATLNTLYYPQGDRWRQRLPIAGAQLAELHADVVGLQEIDRAHGRDRMLAALAPAMAYDVIRAAETQRDRYPRHWDGVVTLVAPRTLSVAGHRVRRLTHFRVVQAVDLRTRDGRLSGSRTRTCTTPTAPGHRGPTASGQRHPRLARRAHG